MLFGSGGGLGRWLRDYFAEEATENARTAIVTAVRAFSVFLTLRSHFAFRDAGKRGNYAAWDSSARISSRASRRLSSLTTPMAPPKSSPSAPTRMVVGRERIP